MKAVHYELSWHINYILNKPMVQPGHANAMPYHNTRKDKSLMLFLSDTDGVTLLYKSAVYNTACCLLKVCIVVIRICSSF
eukprot:GAHX01000476.1.p1 GENE.GAHX01000476.1~~GAHX01000476.1.p1  ORF type:complete len:80 (+),score=1.29 GAHX01000476.1:87-326(+)